LRPSDVTDFGTLYGRNCAACHGANGKFGAALGLNNPVYLAIVDDESMRRVIAEGVPGTAMPPFAQSAGGDLTDRQVQIVVAGIRKSWAGSVDMAAGAPPYHSSETPDPARGEQVYASRCQSCHSVNGNDSRFAGSIVDPSYLSLVSNQYLRTIIIAGRPDLGHPDWRGSQVTSREISDVVAWLASKRSSLFLYK